MIKKLKISKNLFFVIIIMFVVFLSSLVFLSKYKVEESFASKIYVSNDNSEKVIVSSENIYKINYDSKLILFYDEQYNEYKITFISKKSEKFILDIEPIKNKTKNLIPGSVVNAKIVYSIESILNIILKYFK